MKPDALPPHGRRLIGILAAVAILLSPLARPQDRTSAITEARYAAVGFALTMDIVTASLGSTCARASEGLSAKAQAARSSWTTHNGHYVDSAHKYLLFVRAAMASERGEDAGAAFYQAQKERFAADAATALTDTFPGGDIDEAGCEKVLSNMSDGSMNLEAKAELFRSLVEIDSAISQMTE